MYAIMRSTVQNQNLRRIEADVCTADISLYPTSLQQIDLDPSSCV